MAVIGVSGKARSGKDTFAAMLAAELNEIEHEPYVLMAYAGELKRRCQEDFDLSFDQLWGDKKEHFDHRYPKRLSGFSSDPSDYWTPREIMQSYGQFFRTIHYDFWVEYLFKVIKEKEYNNVIITDVRHINEADAVKKHGGIVIRVIRDVDSNIHGKDHISETALDDYNFDWTVINNYSLQVLQQTAKETVSLIKSTQKLELEL